MGGSVGPVRGAAAAPRRQYGVRGGCHGAAAPPPPPIRRHALLRACVRRPPAIAVVVVRGLATVEVFNLPTWALGDVAAPENAREARADS